MLVSGSLKLMGALPPGTLIVPDIKKAPAPEASNLAISVPTAPRPPLG